MNFLQHHIHWIAPLITVGFLFPIARLFSRVQKLETTSEDLATKDAIQRVENVSLSRIENLETKSATKEALLRIELDTKQEIANLRLEIEKMRSETHQQIADIAIKLEAVTGELKAVNATLAGFQHQFSLMMESQLNQNKP